MLIWLAELVLRHYFKDVDARNDEHSEVSSPMATRDDMQDRH
jgi:hypothetical protein